jgi:predicted HTH domain antitoxin
MPAHGPTKSEHECWRAEDDLRTLVGARKIRKDKDRLAKAVKLAKEQLRELQDIES